MSRKIILTLVAVAALGASALVPTSASARGGHAGHHPGGHVGHHPGGHFGHHPGGHFGHHPGGHFHARSHFGHFGRFGHFWRFGRFSHHGHYAHYWNHGHYRWWNRYHRSYGYPAAQSYAQTPQAAVPRAPAAPGNCLAKNYLADGTVVFRDLCTQEAAEGTPPNAPVPQK
jgi:hypothetical protein